MTSHYVTPRAGGERSSWVVVWEDSCAVGEGRGLRGWRGEGKKGQERRNEVEMGQEGEGVWREWRGTGAAEEEEEDVGMPRRGLADEVVLGQGDADVLPQRWIRMLLLL